MSIFQPIDIAAFIKSGHATPANERGDHRVYKDRLYSRSVEYFGDDHVHVDNAVPEPSPLPWEQEDPFVVLPDMLISEATLRYVGYRPEVAASMWAQWAGNPDRKVDADHNIFIMPFHQYIFSYAIENGPYVAVDFEYSFDQWDNALHVYGLNKETRQAITDTSFAEIRETETCLFWAVDTIRMRYRGLIKLQEYSQRREQLALQNRQ